METLFTDAELTVIEGQNVGGLSSGEIVELFFRRGAKFSEATFRKYVQLGLLSRSRRVGSKGKHKGSKGVYPVAVVRQINEIKSMMALGYTIEDIRRYFAFVGGEIEELRSLVDRLVERLEESISEDVSESFMTSGVRRQIAEVRDSAEKLVAALESIANRIREVRKLAKEAV